MAEVILRNEHYGNMLMRISFAPLSELSYYINLARVGCKCLALVRYWVCHHYAKIL